MSEPGQKRKTGEFDAEHPEHRKYQSQGDLSFVGLYRFEARGKIIDIGFLVLGLKESISMQFCIIGIIFYIKKVLILNVDQIFF